MNNYRKQVIIRSLIPQAGLLTISAIYALIFKRDIFLSYYKISFKLIFLGILIGAIISFLGYGYYLFSKRIKSLRSTAELFEGVLAPVYGKMEHVDIFLLSFCAAFCEETFFRGVLVPHIGVYISSFLFGILHLPDKKYWIYAVWAFASGVIFSNMFLYSQSLTFPILAHATNNVIGMYLLKRLSR